MAIALENAPATGYYEQLRAVYTARRDRLAAILDAAGLETLPAGQLLPAGRHRHLGFPDDVAFCRYLTTEIGVAAIPPSAFYADPKRPPPSPASASPSATPRSPPPPSASNVWRRRPEPSFTWHGR